MRVQVSRWGNSLAVRLPKAAVEGLKVREGEALEMELKGGTLTMRPARPRYRLKDLIAEITPGNQPETVEFPPAGEELL